MKEFAIEIFVKGETYRFATVKMLLQKTSSCNASESLLFLPYITSINPFSSEINFKTDKSAVSTARITLWDAHRDVVESFKSFNYEVAEVVVYSVNDQFEIDNTLYGYMTDVSFKGGQVSFTVRSDEDQASVDYMKQYSYDSFQFFTVPMLYDVGVTVEFDINDKAKWTVMGTDLPRKWVGPQYKTGVAVAYKPTPGGRVNPDVSAVILKATTNTYTQTTLDYGQPEGETTDFNYLKDTENVLIFEAGDGTAYHKAVIGSDYGKEEFVYGYCRQGFVWNGSSFDTAQTYFNTPDSTINSLYILSGIPTSWASDPLGIGPPDSSLRMLSQHRKSSLISASDTFDSVWIASNGFTPEAGSSTTRTGFVYTGTTVNHPIQAKEFKAFSRFEIAVELNDLYDSMLRDSTVRDGVLHLKIHSKFPSDTHKYAVDITSGSFDIKTKLGVGDPAELAFFEIKASYFDIHIKADGATYEALKLNAGFERGQLKDRWRGFRFDMLEDFGDFIQDAVNGELDDVDGAAGGTISKINASLINAASGKFGVCVGSEVVEDGLGDPYERLFFASKGEDKNPFYYLDEGLEEDATYSQPYVDYDRDPEQVFMNYLTYDPDIEALSDLDKSQGDGFDTFINAAKVHFLNGRYRVVIDPVPENSQDLGKYFPIVYGNVDKVPLIQAVSKKAYGDNNSTAGDDTYIYAAHACNIKTPQDIMLWIFDKQDSETPVESSDYSHSVRKEFVKSPFPALEDDHYVTRDGVTTGLLGRQILSTDYRYFGKLYNPYHNLVTKNTLDGDTMHGIQLRGAEWVDILGALDKRYPIRNGVGDTILYGSYGGHTDNNGMLIRHPIDIIKHFIITYGKYPYSSDSIDEENYEYIKSLTRRYEAAVFIDKLMSVEDFVAKIAKQFGLYSKSIGGKILFSFPDMEAIRYDKPLSDGINILENVEEITEGYKSVYNEINYSYKKNYVSGNFDKLVKLDKFNNEYCAAASKAKAQRKEFKIEADWVNSTVVARDVANRYAKIYSPKSTKYKLNAKYVDGIRFIPGDVVPMTHVEYDLTNEPVLITKVTEEREKIILEVVKIG